MVAADKFDRHAERDRLKALCEQRVADRETKMNVVSLMIVGDLYWDFEI